MLELDKIYTLDAIEGLSLLPGNSIDLIITSPPYNKGATNKAKNSQKSKWNNTIDYNGDPNNDNLPEPLYQQWQIDILNQCHRVLKPNGSMFYNHKNRINSGKGEIISPYQWLFKTNFKIRQEIIWDRKSTNNVCRRRYLPTTELIFWLTKSNNPTFDRKPDTPFKKEVWEFPFEINTKHPAPYPLTLPDNIIRCIKTTDEPIIVLDPFIGSGTTAIAAIKHDCHYIGFDKFQEYVNMTEERINNYMQEQQNSNPK